MHIDAKGHMRKASLSRAYTYIPNDDGARSPFDASLQVLRQGDVVKEELEQVVGFFLLVADDLAGDFDMLAVVFPPFLSLSLFFYSSVDSNLHCGFT